MKTKNVVLTALVALFASVLAFAKEPGDPKLVVITQKPGVFKVIYEAAGTGKVSMRISDADGKEVFAETIHESNGFIRPVNFDGMQPGVYTIEVADHTGKQIQKVRYANEASVTNVHVSKMNTEGKYLLAIANTGTDFVNVKIFDGGNNLVHNEDLTIKGNFGLVYNLTQVAGTPTFEITDKSGSTQVIK